MNFLESKAWVEACLDTQLSDKLYYHGKHHTQDVLAVTEELCGLEGVDDYHTLLLRTAALFHDVGFTKGNQEHEAKGCEIAREKLPEFGYTQGEIDVICGMIMATKIPQSPKTKYEKIICDADLDYLGRDDFYTVGDTLYKELLAHNVLSDVESWNRIQVFFLESHQYFTQTNINRRTGKKLEYLNSLKELVSTY